MKPLQQFEIRSLLPLKLLGWDISLTNSALFMILAVVLLTIFFTIALRKSQVVPSKTQSLAEVPLDFLSHMVKETNGVVGLPYLSLICSIFFFVFMGNFLGLFPYAFTFTSQLVVNFALALIVVGAITVIGVIKQGFGYLRIFWPSGVPALVAPILVPIEIISYFSRPVSLAIRLFANMVAGHSMMKIFGYFSVMLGIAGVLPLAINIALILFEGLVAFLQAYVFAILSCIYLNDALHGH
jgi:F-type H+-transporting ATPase subunit a